MQVSIPRILVSSGFGQGGKSLLSTGLAVSLRKRGLSISCCVTGPNLLQSVIFNRLSKRYTRCLDISFISRAEVFRSLHHASLGSDIIIIDGKDSFLDGDTVGRFDHQAEFASSTGTPVLMLIPSGDFNHNVAALLRGYGAVFPQAVLKGLSLMSEELDAMEITILIS